MAAAGKAILKKCRPEASADAAQHISVFAKIPTNRFFRETSRIHTQLRIVHGLLHLLHFAPHSFPACPYRNPNTTEGERPRRSKNRAAKTTTTTAELPAAAVEAEAAPVMMSRTVASISEQSPFPEDPIAAAEVEAEAEAEAETDDLSEDSGSGNMMVSPASQTTAATAATADDEEEIARPVYIAPKTKTNSLRGSIVIKADVLKKARSPSEEEKSNFPRMFLNSLTKGASGSR